MSLGSINKMKIKELRLLSEDELAQKERSLLEELSQLNTQRYSARVDKPHKFSLIRKDIARIKTLLQEKKVKKNG